MLHKDYNLIYPQNYLFRSDGMEHWKQCKLRYGDALAAIAYSLGITSFEEFKEIFNFSDEYGKDPNSDYVTAPIQIERLLAFANRIPRSVIDIGGGRCEVAATLGYIGAKVQVVEPNILASEWLSLTLERLYQVREPLDAISLISEPVPECVTSLNLKDVDTVFFVESIEHIPEECFSVLWEFLKPTLQANKGMLVVTNWLDYHPIMAENKEHCRLVDDGFYDELAKDGTTVYRNKSHLVVSYGN